MVGDFFFLLFNYRKSWNKFGRISSKLLFLLSKKKKLWSYSICQFQAQEKEGEAGFVRVLCDNGSWLSLLRPAPSESAKNASVYFEGIMHFILWRVISIPYLIFGFVQLKFSVTRSKSAVFARFMDSRDKIFLYIWFYLGISLQWKGRCQPSL